MIPCEKAADIEVIKNEIRAIRELLEARMFWHAKQLSAIWVIIFTATCGTLASFFSMLGIR